MVKNPPSNAGDAGSIPGRGTKIPHPAGQLSPAPQLLSPCTSSREPVCRKLQSPRALEPVPQLERENPHATTTEKPAHRN